MNIKKGDLVLIIKGKDRGKSGKISQAIPKKGLITIAGVNVGKKHLKPNQKNPHGGIVNFNSPIKSANVALICPRCNKNTRVAYKIIGKSKLRICKKCNEAIDTK